MKLLFLRKRGCLHSDRAERFLRTVFDTVSTVESEKMGDQIPDEISEREIDAIFAFRSHVIVRRKFLERARISLNFHPGPPERPGTGCVNLALFEGDARYGATCHHMDEGIDSGPIVDVRYFKINQADNVASLLERTYDYMLCQLYDVAQLVVDGVVPSSLPVAWARKATRKGDMDRLREVKPDTTSEALERQIRATDFGDYRPFVTIHGRRFRLDD